jgi:hypothetical protein
MLSNLPIQNTTNQRDTCIYHLGGTFVHN